MSASASRGFTLVELLVGLAVMALVLVVVTGIVTMISRNTTSSRAGVEAALVSQKIFSAVGRELAGMVRRDDVANAVGSNGTLLALLTEVAAQPSPAGTQHFGGGAGEPAVVTYVLGKDPGTFDPMWKDRPALLRAAKGAYSGDSLGISSGNLTVPLPFPASTTGGPMGTGDYDILAHGVVRAVITLGSLEGGVLRTWLGPNSLRSKRTLTVSLAVLDDFAGAKVTPAAIEAAAAALRAVEPQATTSGAPEPGSPKEMVAAWQERWEQGAPSDVPEHLWRSLRFFQKTFEL